MKFIHFRMKIPEAIVNDWNLMTDLEIQKTEIQLKQAYRDRE